MSHDFEAMRLAMVESQLRTSAVDDRRVVKIMSEIPRENFVPSDKASLAYAEMLLPLVDGRRMNLPLATGRLITELGLSSDDHVLVVGSAGGYTSALCSRIAKSVIALEEDDALVTHGKAALSDYSNVECVQGALTEGWEQGGPYDAILVDGAVEHIPQVLVDQLADGGRLTSGLIEDGVTRLVFGRKLGDAFGTSAYLDAQATQLPGFERPREFVF